MTAVPTTTPDSFSSPEFDAPPVEEVALAVFVSPLGDLRLVDLAPVKSEWAEKYPIYEENRTLAPVPLESPSPSLGGFSVERPRGLRATFMSSRRDVSVQIQSDRLVQNWRRENSDEAYPRYASLRGAFVETLEAFRRSREVGSESLVPLQCEVTYVNVLDPLKAGELGTWIAPWSGEGSDGFLPAPSRVSLSSAYDIIDDQDDERFRGRLHASLQTALRRNDSREVVRLRMIGRVLVGDPTDANVMAALDLAHEWVVNGFVTLTTPHAHAEWKKIAQQREGKT